MLVLSYNATLHTDTDLSLVTVAPGPRSGLKFSNQTMDVSRSQGNWAVDRAVT